MLTCLPISPSIQKIIDRHQLKKKFEKQLTLLLENPSHPSLHVETLEPKWRGFHSFRIDLKYRAIFSYHSDTDALEIIAVTVHYR